MIRRITPEQLHAFLQAGENIYLVDVRQPREHDYCRLPESVLVPLPELMDRLDEITPPAGALTVVYCHHGVRSLSGAAILQQAGIENVASLDGGIEGWSLGVDASVPRY